MANQPVALVTGGSRGIGRGICTALARTGFDVLVNFNNNLNAAEETRELVEQAGGHAEICQADIAVPENRELLLAFCMEHFGRIDVLVNNAGIAPPIRTDLLATTINSYDKVLNVNLKAPFFMSQAAANLMLQELEKGLIDHATIVNISSISAYTVSVNRGEYCISKAGLSMVTSLFADRLAKSPIRVYEVRPGVIETDMTGPVRDKYDKLIKEGLTPIPRWGQPDDVGKAVAMLAGGSLPFSTGDVINVDGGFHMRRL